MTPAVNAAKRAGIEVRLHRYRHDPSVAAYGLEAAEALRLPTERVFKTLVVALDDDPRRLAVAVIPVDRQLDLKVLAREFEVKHAAMAEARDAERATGYVVGGISPLGQKRRLPTVVHETAGRYDTVFVSAGRRGLEIELAAGDLLRLTAGRLGAIAR